MERTASDINSRDSSSSAETGSPHQLMATNASSNAQLSSRRGHFKSRLGCFNCKRRRVKCNELRPFCSPCIRLGLSCAYPAPAPPTAALRSNPTLLSLNDLQFYHRFLTAAFPTLPLRADKVWAKCAAMSHQSECLAHAVLGLGASHLTRHGNADYTSQALNHRLAAIQLVNEQFIKPPKDADTADALFAAIICLATQTSMLPDGMIEYLTITRGGALVWAFVIPQHKTSLFSSFTNESHDESLSKVVSEEPKDFEIPDEFLASIMELKPLCKKSYELQYCQRIIDTIDGLRVSSLQAWKAHADLWRAHSYFDNDTFEAFTKHDNYVAQLLIVHMFLLDYVLGPMCLPSSEKSKFPARKNTVISWARKLLANLPPKFKVYGSWIEKYCNQLQVSDVRCLLTP